MPKAVFGERVASCREGKSKSLAGSSERSLTGEYEGGLGRQPTPCYPKGLKPNGRLQGKPVRVLPPKLS
jgi:hypothetical protein